MKSTKLIYLEDSYQTNIEATVVNITKIGKKYSVILDQTIFYPQSGGQPADTGVIEGETGKFIVDHVKLDDGLIIHQGTLEGTVEPQQKVTATIDWNARYKNMQTHTAGHLIDEAVKNLSPEFQGIDGMHGINNQQYIEFNGFINESYKSEITDYLQKNKNLDQPIISETVTLAEIKKRGILLPFEPSKNKPVRVVSFGDNPPVPDAGTQLKNSNEVWPILLTDFEYQDGNTRIHYTLTPPAKKELPETKEATTKDTSLAEFQQQIDALANEIKQDEVLSNEAFQQKYSSKKGKFNQLAKSIKSVSPKDRGTAGKLLNQLKLTINSQANKQADTKKQEWFDVTLPGIKPQLGHAHLISQTIKEVESIFASLGFVRRRYQEIETDWYYAEGLNIPKDHPARDDQETFYFSDNVVLTAHTSNGQLREMEFLKEPPIKMINIGKTYRRQASNTHSPMFHQFEGLLVDKNINMSHLVGVSNYFAQHYFGPDREIRLRPHHFQFTEPSFEVDINCNVCKGTGSIHGHKCKVCKSGWLELGGAGMVHPTVLKNGGIDPNKYSGFAFGWGIERIIMMKHQVTDNLRQLYTDDLRFLQQG